MRLLTWRKIDDLGAETGSPPLAKFNNERDNPAQAVNDALDDERKQALNALLAYDPSLGRSRLTWLRTPPQSTSAPSMLALLERLTYVRAIALPRHLGDNIHPARRAQFAREGGSRRSTCSAISAPGGGSLRWPH